MPFRKLLVVLAACAGIAFAHAQTSIGTVIEVNGVVTATQGTSGMTVTQGMAIENGTRFVTPSSGSVTLRLNSGCTVTVPPNHGVTVVQTMTCPQLVAAVQPIVLVGSAAGTAAGTAAAGTAGSSALTAMLVQGLVAAGAVGIVTAGFTQVIQNDEPLSAR